MLAQGRQVEIGIARRDGILQSRLQGLAERERQALVLARLLSKTCTQVCSVLFLPRAVFLTVLVPDRRHFPDCRWPRAGGSARRYRLTRHG